MTRLVSSRLDAKILHGAVSVKCFRDGMIPGIVQGSGELTNICPFYKVIEARYITKTVLLVQ